MKRNQVPVLFTLLIVSAMMLSCGGRQASLELLENEIQDRIDRTQGDFAVFFQDVSDPNRAIIINADEMFHAASTMKTPVMIEVFKQAEAGNFNLSDSIEIKNEFRSIVDGSPFSLNIDRDSGDDLYNFLGKKKTIYDVTHSMITVSGNLATNNIIDLVGADNANSSMHELGAANIKVLRGVEDMKAFNLGLNNETSARDLGVIFKKLATLSLVSPAASDQMIEILKDQKINKMIPGHLPGDVAIAHKTGSITGISHDSGIVFLPDGRSYVLVILSKNLSEAGQGTEAGADISRLVYDFMNS